VRQEFILLSDVLGISTLVETINHRTGGTSTVLGPVHMVASPPRDLGADIALDGKGTACLVSGEVTGPDGEPLAAASVDVWRTDKDGFYDVQQPGIQPAGNLRGICTTDEPGRFWFRSVVPRYYPRPRRLSGGTAARRDRAAPEPAGAPAFHRRGTGIPAGHDTRPRGRQPRPGLRRRLRGVDGVPAHLDSGVTRTGRG